MYALNTFFAVYAFLRHVIGANKRSIGKISNLPANISKINTSFDHHEKSWKEPIGPTAPSPGPILFKVAVTDVKPVANAPLSPWVRLPKSKEIIAKEITKMATYAIMYAWTERTTSSSTTLPSSIILLMRLGCKVLPISLPALLPKSNKRETLMPPPVLPAHAPINIKPTKIICENAGHASKFSVAKPVVETTDATEKAACFNASPKFILSPIAFTVSVKNTLSVTAAIAPTTIIKNHLTSSVKTSFHLRRISK